MRELSILETKTVAGGGVSTLTFGDYVLTVNDAQVACTVGGVAAGVIVADAGGGFISVQVASRSVEFMCDKTNNADWSLRDQNGNTPIGNAVDYISGTVGNFISGLISAIQNAAAPKPPRDPDAQSVHPGHGLAQIA